MHFSRMRTARSSSRRWGGGGGLPQCMLGYPLSQVWAWRPPWVWAWKPLETPLGVGLENTPPPQRPDPLTSWVWPGDLQGMLGYHPPLETCCKACWDTTCNACWDTTPSSVNRITDTCKNITPNFVAGGNKPIA